MRVWMLLNWLSFDVAYLRGSTGFSIIWGFSYQYLGQNTVKIKTLHRYLMIMTIIKQKKPACTDRFLIMSLPYVGR